MCGHRCRAWALRRGPHICPLLERVLVSTVVLALLGVSRRIGGPGTWFLGPFILTAGAVLPTWAHGGRLSDLGLRLGRMRREALLLVVSGVCLLALGFAGVLMLKHWSIEPPASISIPRNKVFLWILFQFMYIALPEELFFRGYILSNSMGLRQRASRSDSAVWTRASLVFSAGLFALAHVLVSGEVTFLLTFFPGLIFAWLYVRVGSLFPSVLMHGAANLGYALMLKATV